MNRVVTRADRGRDMMALLVLLAGAGLYAYAWFGMHNLATQHLVIPKGIAAMRYFDTYWQMFRLAKVILAVGVAVLAWSFWQYSGRNIKTTA